MDSPQKKSAASLAVSAARLRQQSAWLVWSVPQRVVGTVEVSISPAVDLPFRVPMESLRISDVETRTFQLSELWSSRELGGYFTSLG
jgi:hypothetical protein